MKIDFFKYQGTGNDFILLDNRNSRYDSLTYEQIALMCHRRFGIGADGLMLLQNSEGYDFEMIYHNADGRPGSMCGNGGRSIVLFAFDLGIVKEKVFFLASDGPHEAQIRENGHIELKMIDVHQITKEEAGTMLDTGSPHYVIGVNELGELDVETEGKKIRYDPRFREKGINVNFIEPTKEGIAIRTYERGVEAETYSCGTGATAAALSVANTTTGQQEIRVQTKGGDLLIKFERIPDGSFQNIWLCGPAKRVFTGTLDL